MSVTRRTTLSRPGLTQSASRQVAPPVAATITRRGDPEAVGRILGIVLVCAEGSGTASVTGGRRAAVVVTRTLKVPGRPGALPSEAPDTPSPPFRCTLTRTLRLASVDVNAGISPGGAQCPSLSNRRDRPDIAVPAR
jgi:hypothetical protein